LSTEPSVDWATAIRPGPCLVHFQGSPGELLAVQPGDRGERMLLAGHLHETESSELPGKHFAHQLHRPDLAERLEQFRYFCFGHIGTEIAHKDVHRVRAPSN